MFLTKCEQYPYNFAFIYRSYERYAHNFSYFFMEYLQCKFCTLHMQRKYENSIITSTYQVEKFQVMLPVLHNYTVSTTLFFSRGSERCCFFFHSIQNELVQNTIAIEYLILKLKYILLN